MKKNIISILLVAGLWISLWGYFYWSVLEMTNLTFMVGLTSLTLFVVLKIIQSGFFELFFKGMRQLNDFVFRKSNAHTRVENQLKKDAQLQEFKKSTYNWFLNLTFALALVSLAMSLLGMFLFYA